MTTPPSRPKSRNRARAPVSGLQPEAEDGPKAAYPMRVVTRITGLNPDTIRAWERRYSAIAPERTGGNTRLFSTADVRRLVLLRDAVAMGHPVSRVAVLPTTDIEKLVADNGSGGPGGTHVEPAPQPFSMARIVDDYLGLVDKLAVRDAKEYVVRATALLSTRDFLMNVVEPLLGELGRRWGTDADRELKRQIVRSQVRASLQALRPFHAVERGAPRVLAASPAPGCDVVLLAWALLASSRALDVVDLGAGIETDLWLLAIEKLEPSVVLVGSDPTSSATSHAKVAAALARLPPWTEAWAPPAPSGPENGDPPRVRRISTFAALDLALVDLQHRA